MRRLMLIFYAAVFAPMHFLHAHGVEVSDVTASAAARTVHFGYSTGDPMFYAKIRVFPPSNPETEILQAITSWNGDFSFVPNETGDWRITAEDGMGHKAEITINVEQLAEDNGQMPVEATGAARTGSVSRIFMALLGISLLANIFAAWNYISKRKNKNAH